MSKEIDIILVDDHLLFREGLKYILSNILGYKIFAEANNGIEFLEIIKHHIPAIVIMDIAMPKMDGIESIELIKVYENLKDIPIIVISANLGPENEEKIKKIANGMMRKPVLQKDLITTIAKFLPHKIIVKEESPITDAVTILPADTPIPPELEKVLREKYLPQVENLKDTMSIDEITNFAKEIKELAEKENCQTIATWSENLLIQAKSFNVSEIENSFDNFGDLIDKAPVKKAS